MSLSRILPQLDTLRVLAYLLGQVIDNPAMYPAPRKKSITSRFDRQRTSIVSTSSYQLYHHARRTREHNELTDELILVVG